MALTRTLAQLRDDVRQTADIVNATDWASDSEVTRRINESMARLYGLLVQARGEDFYRTSSSASTVANQRHVAMPSDFLALVGVDVTVSGSTTIEARPINFNERARFFQDTSGWHSYREIYYSIEGPRLVFFPTPRAVHSVTIWYVPCAPTLSADGDTFDGINRWEHWVVIDAAIQLMAKEETDTSALVLERERMEREIVALARHRDRGYPDTARDVRMRFKRWTDEWWNP